MLLTVHAHHTVHTSPLYILHHPPTGCIVDHHGDISQCAGIQCSALPHHTNHVCSHHHCAGHGMCGQPGLVVQLAGRVLHHTPIALSYTNFPCTPVCFTPQFALYTSVPHTPICLFPQLAPCPNLPHTPIIFIPQFASFPTWTQYVFPPSHFPLSHHPPPS